MIDFRYKALLFNLVFLVLASPALASPPPCEPGSTTGDGEWSDATIWSNSCSPAYNYGRNSTVTVKHNVTVASDMTIGNNATLRVASGGSLTFDPGVSLSVKGAFIVEDNGYAYVDDELDVNGGATLDVQGSGGELEISGNGNLTGNGGVSVGGTFTSGGNVDIGGTGDFELLSGANLDIGQNASLIGTGKVEMAAGSKADIGGNLDIGGTGDFQNDGDLFIGGSAAKSGAGGWFGTGSVDIVGTGCTFWEGPGTCNSGVNPLPVKLVFFKAKNKNGSVEITWATAEEVNTSHFEVEKSLDGKNFTTLLKKYAHGYSHRLIHYNAWDHSSFNEPTYYRLKQVDRDGQVQYSPMVAVMPDTDKKLKVFPNPAEEHITLAGYETQQWQQIRILNMNGEVVDSYHGNHDNGQFSVGRLKPGTYFIQLIAPDSKKELTFEKR